MNCLPVFLKRKTHLKEAASTSKVIRLQPHCKMHTLHPQRKGGRDDRNLCSQHPKRRRGATRAECQYDRAHVARHSDAAREKRNFIPSINTDQRLVAREMEMSIVTGIIERKIGSTLLSLSQKRRKVGRKVKLFRVKWTSAQSNPTLLLLLLLFSGNGWSC